MGNGSTKIIQVDNMERHLSQCEDRGQKNCPIYGNLHLVVYNDLDIMLGEAKCIKPPPLISLHYLVKPNLLIIPSFTLLQQSKPSSLDSLIELMTGVAQVASRNQICFGHKRIGFSGRWGIVGQKQIGWSYKQAFQNPNVTGVYLSPQLMLQLSQQKLYPKHNPVKSDMFTFGIMILQIIFQQKLTNMFDYREFQIKLKPLLEKLNVVRQEFGQQFYEIILQMLQLDEQQRIDFNELLYLLNGFNKKSSMLSSKMTTSTTSNDTRSPLSRKSSTVYKNDCSPFKGGKAFSQNIMTERNSIRTPTKLGTKSTSNKSPLKRDLRINTQFGKQNTYDNGYQTCRSPNKPTLLRKQGLSPLSRR